MNTLLQNILMQSLQNNPNYKQVMQMCKDKNPKDVFYDECRKRNIDPDQVIEMLQNKGE